jgi:hypothetical protein
MARHRRMIRAGWTPAKPLDGRRWNRIPDQNNWV